jgi:hypothetical protein
MVVESLSTDPCGLIVERELIMQRFSESYLWPITREMSRLIQEENCNE